MTNLSVTYSSQWDPDAKGSVNDCGPASLKMILKFYGEETTTDEVFKRTGAGPGLITIGQMKQAVESYGFTCEFKTGLTPQNLRELLDQQILSVALVHYGSLISRQDRGFQGGHFFLPVGYRDDGYFVNDPNFWGQYRQDGDHHFYTREEFENAWGSCNLDGNPNNSLFIVYPKVKSVALKYDVFEKLVRKGASLDKIGEYLHYPQDMIDGATFGDLVIEKNIKHLETRYNILYGVVEGYKKKWGTLDQDAPLPTFETTKDNLIKNIYTQVREYLGRTP